MMDSSSNGLPSSAPVPVEDNLEEILMELNKFERNLRESSAAAPASVSDSHITPLLEDYLSSVARTGTAHFPWPKIKPLFRAKLELVIDQFHDFSPADNLPPVPNVDAFSFAACREKVFQQLDCFGGIPFTVQRLCELMVSPRKHYKRSDKFMRALEKNMLVVSTVDPKSSATLQPPPPPQQRRQSSGMANSSASPVLMNGDHRKDERDTDESMTGEPEKKHARLAQPESTPSLSSASAGHLVSDSEEMDVDESPATGTNLSSPVAGRVGEGPCDSRDVDMQLAGEVGSSPKRQRPDAGGTAPLAQNEDDDGMTGINININFDVHSMITYIVILHPIQVLVIPEMRAWRRRAPRPRRHSRMHLRYRTTRRVPRSQTNRGRKEGPPAKQSPGTTRRI